MLVKYVSLVCIVCSSSTYSWIFPRMKISTFPLKDCKIEEAVSVTSVLEKGHFKEAQQFAKVTPEIGNVTSYAGYFTVNEKCDSNLFFWFFPAQNTSWEDAPVLLWLQGGPGAPSTYGLFEEVGPFQATEHGLRKREYSWNVKNNLLFIDQPVGTGYSFTSNKKCYPKNEEEVGVDLYQAIVQFYQLFPQLQRNKFYASGESYAGHFIPALGHAIHQNNPSAKVKINLAAMIIGNGWVDPKSQIDYGDYLYQLGLLDDKQRNIIKIADSICEQRLRRPSTSSAYSYLTLLKCHVSIGRLFDRFVGNVSVYNYLKSSYEDLSYWQKFLQSCEVRRALNVGNKKFQDGTAIYYSLAEDHFQSVTPWVEELLELYPIIFYNGQLDVICAYPMTSKFINALKWSDQKEYLNGTRSKWCVNEEQAGYFKGKHHLYDVLVRGAGHMVPADQPLWAYTLINSITSGPADNPFHALTKCDSSEK